LSFCLYSYTVFAQEETFSVDRSHSVIGFSIKIAGGFSEVDGKFTDFKVTTMVESETYKLNKVNVEIQATSINTGTDGRDNHLRTDDFFDVENYPTITFNSTKIIQNGADYEIEGDFTMHGITNRITMPLKRTHSEKMVWIFGSPNIIYEGSHTLDRTEYKIKATTRWNSIIAATGDMAMSDEVSIRLKIITRGASPSRTLAEAASKDGASGFTEAYSMLEAKYPGADIFDENLFSSVGRSLSRQKNNKAIVEVYQIWIDKYPESSRAHYSLGQAYVNTEETKLAKKQFKKALDLDPENEDAKNQLAKLDD
jgi:polyisoprenoid-binding protein YceI